MAAREHRQQPLLNQNTDVWRIRSSTDPKPNGEAFCLKAPDKSIIHGYYICYFLLIAAPIGCAIGFVLCMICWISGDGGYDYQDDTIGFAVATIILVIIGLFAFGCCPFQRNAEKWLDFWMIISIEESTVYILYESTKKNWKIVFKIAFSKLRSIGTQWSRKSKGLYYYFEEAWVILALSDGRKITMNDISCDIETTQKFVKQINKYLEQIHKQREIEIRQNDRRFIQQLIQNGAIVVRDNVDRGGSLSQAAAPAGMSQSEGDNDLINNHTLQSNDVMEEVVIEKNERSKQCANCGEMIAIGHKFCDNCGTETMFDDEQEKKCVKCDGPLSKKSKFCPNCGTKTNEFSV